MDDFTPIIDEVNSKVLSKKLLFTVFIPFILSHQIFRNQISEHRLWKIRQSRLLNRSIFGLVLSDDKLTVSPIYTCIQMEVAFVGLFYANICTTFAIYLKRRRRTVVFILQPPWYEMSIYRWLYGTDPPIIVLYDESSVPFSHPFSSDKVKGAALEAHHL